MEHRFGAIRTLGRLGASSECQHASDLGRLALTSVCGPPEPLILGDVSDCEHVVATTLAAFASVPAQRSSPGIWTWPRAGGSEWLGLSGDGVRDRSRYSPEVPSSLHCTVLVWPPNSLYRGQGCGYRWLAPRILEEGAS